MDFTKVATFGSRLEAETVAHALDKHRIPFMIKSDDIGMFGPGSSSATPQGAVLLVPDHCASQAKEVLSGLID